MKNQTLPIHGRILFSDGTGVHGVKVEITQNNPKKSLLETVTDFSGWFAGELQSNELCELVVRVFDGLGRELITEKITVSEDLSSISQLIHLVVTDKKKLCLRQSTRYL